MDKTAIIKNFSRSAHTYDKFAVVQQQAASELIGNIKVNGVHRILEIGCGTGNYTLLLRNRFKNAHLKAVDISRDMLEVAAGKIKNRQVEFIAADAENIIFNEEFDLITSNACFQWFEDLERAVTLYKNLLKKGGRIIFSIFGPRTFWELGEALKCCGKKIPTGSGSFISREKLKTVLSRNFKQVNIKEAVYEERFSCLLELLYKIKYTGTGGVGLQDKKIFTAAMLKKAEKIYLDKFKEIKASSQVFYCRGKR